MPAKTGVVKIDQAKLGSVAQDVFGEQVGMDQAVVFTRLAKSQKVRAGVFAHLEKPLSLDLAQERKIPEQAPERCLAQQATFDPGLALEINRPSTLGAPILTLPHAAPHCTKTL